jgi:serine/threonine protein kinase
MEHEGQYKIIDLGFSKKLDIAHEQAEVKGTILGTVTTMAPEVLSKQSYGLKVPPSPIQADIWSIGVIFFQMVFGVLLYDSVSARQRLKEIEEKRYFSPDKELTFNGITVSVDANNFLFRALEVST